MFRPDATVQRIEPDPSGDAKGTAMQANDQGFNDPVPGMAPTGYVKAYDEGRPRH